jgi:hypothetical protein
LRTRAEIGGILTRNDDLLTLVDPTSPDETRFDPHGESARGVLAAAIERGTDSPSRAAPFRRPRVIAGIAGASLAVLVAVAVLVGGDSTLRPADALAHAVDRTAAFESGVIRYRIEGAAAGHRLDATREIRFSGADMEMTQRGEEVLQSGAGERHDSSYRLVDGRHWIRTDDPPGDWRLLGRVPDDRSTLAERTRAEVGNATLVELVKTASNVRRDGSTLSATLDGAAVRALSVVPFGLDRGPATPQIGIEVGLADNGAIERLVVRTPGITRTVEYSQLGAPQVIAAPQR